MIIVEGCDGTGKTTLVQTLADDLHLQLGKRGVENRDLLYEVTRQDTYGALSGAVAGYASPRIWDRLFFSELVYHKPMQRDNQFKLPERDYILAVLKALKCPIIFCSVPLEVATENIEKAHQMDTVSENLPYIHGAYESLAQSVEGAHTYDYRTPSAYGELVADVIEPYLLRRKDREWRHDAASD